MRYQFIKNTIYRYATSRGDFYVKLAQTGISIYTREGTIVGIKDGSRKIPFSKIGISPQDLQELDRRKEILKLKSRVAELEAIRERKRNKKRNKGLDR